MPCAFVTLSYAIAVRYVDGANRDVSTFVHSNLYSYLILSGRFIRSKMHFIFIKYAVCGCFALTLRSPNVHCFTTYDKNSFAQFCFFLRTSFIANISLIRVGVRVAVLNE